MQFAKRLEKIPPYLFAEIVHKQPEFVAKGSRGSRGVREMRE
jgi:LL-diaminopimelate aminotransferase